MASKKLSIYLKRFYLPEHIESEDSMNIVNIAFAYTNDYQDKIFQQPKQAKRAMIVEMQDIFKQLKEYENYIHSANKEMGAMHDKYGTHFGEKALRRLKVLEKHRNLWADWAYCIHDALGYMTRLLLEHYSEEELGVPFLERFAEYMGPFDWMSKRAKHFIDKLSKEDSVMDDPKLEIEYIKNWREEFELSEFLEPLYGYTYNEVNQDLLDFVRSKGYEGQQCSHKDKLCENCIGSWLMNQYRAKLVRDASPFPSYKHKLDFILKNIKLLHLDTTSILIDGEYFTSEPQNEEEAGIYATVWWEYNRKKILKEREEGTETIHEIPVVTFHELKQALESKLIKSPKPKELIEKELARAKSFFTGDKTNKYIKESYDYHYDLKVYAETITYVHDKAVMDRMMKNYVRFGLGALIEHYVSYVVHLETIELESYITHLKIAKEMNFLDANDSENLSEAREYCCQGTKAVYKHFIEFGVTKEELDLLQDAFLRHKFDSIESDDKDDIAIIVSDFIDHCLLFDREELQNEYYRKTLEIIEKGDNTTYQKKVFLNQAKKYWHDDEESDEVDLSETELVTHAQIAEPQKMEKIQTTFTVEELAILFRLLYDAGYIKSDDKKSFRKVLPEIFKSKSAKKNGDFQFNTLKKYFNDPSASGLANMNQILTKLTTTLDNL